MTYEALIEEVKTEGRIKADDDFQPMVIALLNELFVEAVLSQRPFELRKNVLITLTAAQQLIPLPDDFLIYHDFVYVDVDTGRTWKLVDVDKAAQPAPRGLYGHPTTFDLLQGNQFTVQPYTGIIAGDKIELGYYVNPPVVAEGSLNLTNPIPRLEPFLVRAAIRRIRMFHSDDTTMIQAISGDVNAAAKAFQKDMPQPPPEDGQ